MLRGLGFNLTLMEDVMAKIILAALLVVLVIPAAATAQSNFDGTWKIDKRGPTKKPYVYLLQNGTYQCKTCVPPIDVPADGQDHKFAGSPYVDTQNVKVVDDRTVEVTGKKNGKVLRTNKFTVSSDGKTLNYEFKDASATDADPTTGKGTFTQVSAGPAGSHAMSGSWQLTKLDESDNASIFTIKMDGDSLTMTSPTGQSYIAKLDGPDAPYKGDPGVTSVSLKRIDANTIEETDKRDGKAIYVERITLAANGKTMTIVNTDSRTGRVFRDEATKQ
jgi:hypothetical protein